MPRYFRYLKTKATEKHNSKSPDVSSSDITLDNSDDRLFKDNETAAAGVSDGLTSMDTDDEAPQRWLTVKDSLEALVTDQKGIQGLIPSEEVLETHRNDGDHTEPEPTNSEKMRTDEEEQCGDKLKMRNRSKRLAAKLVWDPWGKRKGNVKDSKTIKKKDKSYRCGTGIRGILKRVSSDPANSWPRSSAQFIPSTTNDSINDIATVSSEHHCSYSDLSEAYKFAKCVRFCDRVMVISYEQQRYGPAPRIDEEPLKVASQQQKRNRELRNRHVALAAATYQRPSIN